MENFKNLYDLCINNSLTDPKDLATGGHDASQEFKDGKAAFQVQGSWEFEGMKDSVPNATMIPYYCGVAGEEKAGLGHQGGAVVVYVGLEVGGPVHNVAAVVDLEREKNHRRQYHP